VKQNLYNYTPRLIYLNNQ